MKALREVKGFVFSVVIANCSESFVMLCWFSNLRLKEADVTTKLATEATFSKCSVCERCQCYYLCKQEMMDRKSAQFSAKGSNFFSSFSFLNGRRIMEMRAGIALSAWNGPSLQTNKNITLPLGKFSFLKAAWIWALNQSMRLLCWGKRFKVWLCILRLVGGYQLLACHVRLLQNNFFRHSYVNHLAYLVVLL